MISCCKRNLGGPEAKAEGGRRREKQSSCNGQARGEKALIFEGKWYSRQMIISKY